jgi:cell division protein FtsI/penicillin-binding protein 2
VSLAPAREDGAIAAAAKPTSTAKDEPERWAIPAGAIDPRLATTIDGHLCQVLEDGTRIHFTLDPRAQDAARDTLARYRVEWGSVVAIRPKTGEILALAEYAHERPDLSRLALNANAPAASVFKIISSAALLEYAHLRPEDQICTHGGHQKLSLYNLKPNERLDTRCESFAQALGSSNNVAFARWADAELEPLQLQAMANRFLFGKRLPFPWAVGISDARVPVASRLGLARTAAGFEGTRLSPLHAALLVATVANDGVMMAPHLIARADRAGETLFEATPAVLAEVLTAPVAKDLRMMLEQTISYGTGKKFFWKGNKPRVPVTVGGKSGSLSGSEEGIKRHYSWFVAFAPVEDPQIAVAALIVQGEQWTIKGAIPVREVLEAWFAGDRELRDDPADRDPLADP